MSNLMLSDRLADSIKLVTHLACVSVCITTMTPLPDYLTKYLQVVFPPPRPTTCWQFFHTWILTPWSSSQTWLAPYSRLPSAPAQRRFKSNYSDSTSTDQVTFSDASNSTNFEWTARHEMPFFNLNLNHWIISLMTHGGNLKKVCDAIHSRRCHVQWYLVPKTQWPWNNVNFFHGSSWQIWKAWFQWMSYALKQIEDNSHDHIHSSDNMYHNTCATEPPVPPPLLSHLKCRISLSSCPSPDTFYQKSCLPRSARIQHSHKVLECMRKRFTPYVLSW